MDNLFLIRRNYKKLIEIILYLLVFLLVLKIVALHLNYGHDYPLHMNIIERYMNGNFYIPHPGFHISVYWLSAVTGIPAVSIIPFFIAFTFILTIIITKRFLLFLSPGIKHELVYTLFAIAINIVIAIYLPWFNENKYLGSWSPNVWHSPTMALLKPFALLAFFGFILLLQEMNNENYKVSILVSIYLLISTLAKPSFIICFTPAICLFILFFRTKGFKLYVTSFLIFLPSLLLLIYQFIETYNLKTTDSYFHDKIIFAWFGVMKVYSNNLLISILSVLAFPLSVLLILRKKLRSNNALTLSWILFIIAFLQAAFLAEQAKFLQGAFISSYIIALFILHVSSLGEYLSWFSSSADRDIHWKEKFIAGSFLFLHFISGILYLNDIVFKYQTISSCLLYINNSVFIYKYHLL